MHSNHRLSDRMWLFSLKNRDNTCCESFPAIFEKTKTKQTTDTPCQHFILNCFFVSQNQQSIARVVSRVSTGMIFNKCNYCNNSTCNIGAWCAAASPLPVVVTFGVSSSMVGGTMLCCVLEFPVTSHWNKNNDNHKINTSLVIYLWLKIGGGTRFKVYSIFFINQIIYQQVFFSIKLKKFTITQ